MATASSGLADSKLSGAFVVEFDPIEGKRHSILNLVVQHSFLHIGNRIVWTYPSDAKLDGIEFKVRFCHRRSFPIRRDEFRPCLRARTS